MKSQTMPSQSLTLSRREFLRLSALFAGGALLSACGMRGAVTPASVASVTQPSTSDARYLVLISIDGCRPDYFEFSDVPNIKKLAADGITYDQAWVGQLRNDTPPSHATIATGAFPRNNGIIGFTWRDSATGKIFRAMSWNNVASGGYNQIVVRSGCSSIGTVYKKAFPNSKVAAVSSDKWYAAAALGANSADFIGYCQYSASQKLGVEVGYTLSPAQVGGTMVPKPEIMNHPELNRRVVNPWDADIWTMDLALLLREKETPEIMLINLSLTDNFGHTTGGIADKPSMTRIINNVDRQIGRIIEAYQKAGIFDKTLFVITSDHGMSQNLHTIDETPMARIVADYGIEKAGSRLEFYLRDPSQAGEAAEKIARLKIGGIHAVYYKHKDRDGKYAYSPTPTTLASIDTTLDACYRYLTSTYATPQSADIVLFPEEYWNTKEATDYYKADHGTATWENQHIPLILSGPGIRKGITSSAPARLVDIAPTILVAMGLQPERMDGVVLADALVSPTDEHIRLQQLANTHLNPLKDALKKPHVIISTHPAKITSFVFTRDYTPGAKDSQGQNLAGNELMRLTAYRGELFASTSTFTDPRLYTNHPDYPGCQVLRKSNSKSGWQVDVSFGRRYLRTDCLEAIRFTRDANGKELSEPIEMLVAGIWDLGDNLQNVAVSGRNRYITIAIRDDVTGKWTLSQVARVPDSERGFASCRAMKVHLDQVTGTEYLFVGVACGGIYKGVYDPSASGRIRWMVGDEVDASFGRVHSMCVCNGSLYVSFDYGGLTVQNQRGGIYRRIDGERPTWERVYFKYDRKYPTWNQTARGITAAPSEDASGKQVILTGVENPPEPIIVRIEPHNGHRAVTELNYHDYFTKVFGRPPQILGGSKQNPHAGVQAAALNYFEPFVNPTTGKVEHFVTLFLVHPDDPAAGNNGAYFLIRRQAGVYDWGEIPSGLPAGQHLRGTRTVEKSPFPDEPNVYYFGGGFAGPDEQPPKPNTAWIYKGTLTS